MNAPSTRRDNLNCMRPAAGDSDSPALKYLKQLLDAGIIEAVQWEALDQRARLELKGFKNLDRLLLRLVDRGLLTPYQSARLQSGQKTGLTLGPYRLLERLGAGTSSVVFKAKHQETGQLVALKVLIPGQEDDQLLVRFDSERRSIAQLKHPNIVRLLDMGEAESQDPDARLLYYYAMEFVSGSDLEAWVSQHGRLSIEETCQLAFQLASALHCAHQHGLVHRDVKPSNVLWTQEGSAKLLDFGLARHQQHRFTQPGLVLGALEYIAPEQAIDGAAVDIRADLFSLGSTLYFCLTGQPPFSARGVLLEVIQARTQTLAPSATILRPDVPERLDTILQHLMELDPNRRFQSPREVMLALEEFVGPQEELRQEEQASPVPQAPERSGEGGRLLVVSRRDLAELDDAAAAMDLLCQQVSDFGQMPVVLGRLHPDIVLVDADSVAVDPLGLVKSIRSAGDPFRKIVLFSDGTTPDLAADYLAAGVDDLLGPPLSSVALQVRLRSLLHLQEAQRRTVQSSAATSPSVQPETPLPESAPKKRGLLRWLWGKK